jgi:predicted DNA-binding ribbon-helix-helix protein
MPSRLINRNVSASCGRTSMRLEPEFWDALRDLCHREDCDLKEIVCQIEAGASGGGRTSAVRVHILEYYRAAAEAAWGKALPNGMHATWPDEAEHQPQAGA